MRRWLILLLSVVAALALLWKPELQHWLPQSPQERPAPYDHDRFGTQPVDQLREFEAFVSSFDGGDDDNGDGVPDTLDIPQWVAYGCAGMKGRLNPAKGPADGLRTRSWLLPDWHPRTTATGIRESFAARIPTGSFAATWP